jgi:DNA-binding NtrC family response regulator
MPEMDGLDLLRELKAFDPSLPIIVMTAYGTVENAVQALRAGAYDYVAKPFEIDELKLTVEKALERERLLAENRYLHAELESRYDFAGIIGNSPGMRQVFDVASSVAASNASVLITGESGTGKELLARSIHYNSSRKEKPFIVLNCAALSEGVLESELFGHEKGAFTGALATRKGRFELADQGTLFIDEVGEMSLAAQVKLLRVIQEHEFERVGGNKSINVNVRIVAATNKNLEEQVKSGRFREDLYYRLNVFPIHIPPLRERREDIPLLMRHFLEEVAEEYQLESPVVASEAIDAILMYHWPGNVRQLRSMCERWVITRHGQRLEREHLPADMTGMLAPSSDLGSFHVDDAADLKQNSDRAVQLVERTYLYKLLQRCGGHLEQTAAEAGISRRTLYTKMKAYGLESGDFRKEG